MSKTHHEISHVKIVNATQPCTVNHFEDIKIVLSNKYSCDVSCIDFIYLCQRDTTGYHTQKFIIARNDLCTFQNPSWIAYFERIPSIVTS